MSSLRVMVKPGEIFNAHVLDVGDYYITVKGRGMIGYIMQDGMAWALIKPKKNKDDPDEFKKPVGDRSARGHHQGPAEGL